MTIDICAQVAFVSIDFTINNLFSLLLDDRLIDWLIVVHSQMSDISIMFTTQISLQTMDLVSQRWPRNGRVDKIVIEGKDDRMDGVENCALHEIILWNCCNKNVYTEITLVVFVCA